MFINLKGFAIHVAASESFGILPKVSFCFLGTVQISIQFGSDILYFHMKMFRKKILGKTQCQLESEEIVVAIDESLLELINQKRFAF